MNRIVVGVDESSTAGAALRWAQAHGAARAWPVTAVMAWDYLDQHHLGDREPFDPEYDAEAALRVASELVDRVLPAGHGVTCEAVLDHPAPALVAAGKSADLVVVGARGLGGFKRLLLGSVSRHVVHHAACPVAVIRDDPPNADGPIVVGVDGSPHSIRALDWAAAWAAAAGRRLIAVRAWQTPVYAAPMYPIVADWEQQQQYVAGALDDALRAALPDGVEFAARVVEGGPARSLLDAAETDQASLLVVGARGHGGVSAALLGSVADQVVHHATCPVVVVP